MIAYLRAAYGNQVCNFLHGVYYCSLECSGGFLPENIESVQMPEDVGVMASYKGSWGGLDTRAAAHSLGKGARGPVPGADEYAGR